MMPAAYLELDRVGARAGGRAILDSVSLSLARGHTLALLGPEGAGKSALLLLLAGFLRPSLGTARLAGRDITMLPPERRDIALVFADDALFPHLSVLDNVGFGLKMRGVAQAERRRRAAATLAELGIAALADRHPARLDAGERRLVALARAVAPRPSLLMIDEKTAGHEAFDTAIRAVLAAVPALLLATNDRARAFALADQVALLRGGAVQQVGTARDLFERPASRFVAGFTGLCNILPADFTGRDGAFARVALPHGGAGALAPDGLPTGPALLCVRPHSVRLDAAGPVRGTVASLAYLGTTTRVTLDHPAGFTADLAQPPGLARGDAVAFGWDAADAWLLPPEPA